MVGQNWAQDSTDTTSGGDSTTTEEKKTCKDGADEYCAACNDGTCTLCYASKVTDGVCVGYDIPLDNCLAYTSETVCLSCNLGYEIDGGKCVEMKSIENCLFAVEGKCTICKNGMVDSEGKCPGTTACTLENCMGCMKVGDNETCVYCADDYRPADGKCVKIETALMGCATVASDKCSACTFGYYVSTYTSATDVKCTKSEKYTSVNMVKWGF